MKLTLKEYISQVKSGKLNPAGVLEHYTAKAKKENDKYNAFIRFEKQIDTEVFHNPQGTLLGAPIAIKDNILIEGTKNTCASKILEGFKAPYTATSIKNLQNNGGVVIGKTNMDEFAMGSSTENSARKPSYNKYGKNRITGGTSGGSAVAVSADLCIAAIGTDTGGSVRQPAALCGVVGMKPTYGRISRYGVQSMASSLDQVGVISKNVDDAEILLKSIMGFDQNDSQSNKKADNLILSTKKQKPYKIALPKQCLGEGLDPRIKDNLLEKIEILKIKGIAIDEIDMPILDYVLAIFYIVMPAESSTNLARFDGLRFGLQKSTHDFDGIMEYLDNIRSQGFGEEVKRRILLGSFVLSSKNYEGYYLKAQKAKKKLCRDLDKLFGKYDFIISPTSPELAWKVGEKTDNPLSMYLADLYTITANLAGLPAISIPSGFAEDRGEKLPIGIQLMGNKREEGDLFSMARILEGI